MRLILSASSLVPTRVRVAKRRDVRPVRRVAARAAVKWSIDGVGCEEMRLGDDTTLKKNVNVVNNVVSCPVAPMDITNMCKSNHGAFTFFDLVFQIEGETLYITNNDCDGSSCVKLNGALLPQFKKIILPAGATVASRERSTRSADAKPESARVPNTAPRVRSNCVVREHRHPTWGRRGCARA